MDSRAVSSHGVSTARTITRFRVSSLGHHVHRKGPLQLLSGGALDITVPERVFLGF